MLNFGLFLLITGLFFSRFALSAGMALVLANTVFYCFKWNKLEPFKFDKPLLVYSSLFILFFITGIYSGDKSFFLERIRIYLPFLFLPFAFSLPVFTKPKEVNNWLFLFFLLVSFTAIQSSTDYFSTHKSFSYYAENGTLIPTPGNHVRYSLMVAFAIFTGAHLFFNFDFKHRFWKFSILVLTVFLCLFLHLLSVRSGILGFYLSGLFIGLREVFIRKRKNLFVTGVILLAFSLTSFQVFPSFQKKFYITCRSVSSLVQKQDIKNLSDSGRVKSIEAGLRLGISNFWTGVGAGDVKSEMVNYYQDHCPELTAKKILPHNQFVFVFAASGLFGLIWFCFVVLYPIFYYRWWNNNLMMSFNIILLSSFLSDHTLETQTRVGFYLVFQLLLIQLSKIQKANPENEANVLPSFLDSMI